MDRKHYKMMNWEEVEAIVYADCKNPFDILGLHQKGKSNLLQVCYPNASKVYAVISKNGKKTEKELEKVDDAGFYAQFFDADFDSYKLKIQFDDMSSKEIYDPYSFQCSVDVLSVKNILKGKSVDAYNHLGNRQIKLNGVEGFLFSVYAPNADRVSLIGEFNDWNETVHIMNENQKIPGLFYIFVPEISSGAEYKYSLKTRNNTYIKLDPFALGIKNGNSLTSDLLFNKDCGSKKKTPSELQILEVDLLNIFKKEKTAENTALDIINKAKLNCYNTVSMLPIQASLNDKYNVYNLFSVNGDNNFSFGSLKEIIEILSKNNLYVLMDLPFALASDCEDGLSYFDGSNLFESEDARKGTHSYYHAMLYDYEKPFTFSYIMSAVAFFMNELNISGFVVSNAGVVIYHDYNKNPGEYIIEEWGNTVNSSGVNFIKKLNAFLHKEFPDSLSVASIYAYYDNVTGKEKSSLGFDYCFNTGATDEILDFICMDSDKRKDHLESFLKFTHFDEKDEKYIYQFSSKENEINNMTVYDRMPGDDIEKLSNLKMAVIYRHLIKGSQLSFHDIDFLSGKDDKTNKCFADFVSEFRKIYDINHFMLPNFVSDLPFSYKCNATEVITREYFDGKDKYVIVFNFSYTTYPEYLLPVSLPGVYTEVFNSDAKKFGGNGIIIRKALKTVDDYGEIGENVLNLKIPALSISALHYRPFTDDELEEIYQKKKTAMIKYVDDETKKINNRLNKEIAALEKEAQAEIKKLKELLKPYDR